MNKCKKKVEIVRKDKTKCSDQFLFSGQFHQTHWSHGHYGRQAHRRAISASSGQNELGGKSKKKPSVLMNFCFLVNFIRHTGPMVTMVARCTGSLSQLPLVEMSWRKKSNKKPNILTNFHLLVYFITHTGPMFTMVTRCTGSLSQLPVVEMSWGKKSKKKPSVLFHFVLWSMSSDTLVPWSLWSPGAQAAYLSFQWSK